MTTEGTAGPPPAPASRLESAEATQRNRLLTEIARCPLVEFNVAVEQPTHPCREVVLHQWSNVPAEARRGRYKSEHHVPEPWIGHIERAPLLFVSSNPSLSSYRTPERPAAFAPPLTRIGGHRAENHTALQHGLSAPKPGWTNEAIIDRYSNAFDVWIKDGVAGVADETGRAGARVPYWVAVRKLAEALFDSTDLRPGLDYALTEVVHCKSRDETGVVSAVSVCAPLYLRRVVALSPARLIVVLGRHARNAVRKVFDYPDPGVLSRPLQIAGRNRRLMFLAHPNARRSRPEYPKTVPTDELADAQGWLRKRRAARGAEPLA